MDNLEKYNKHKMPPEWALKEIQAGRLKGKTDINPQWRIEALTEDYGLCGIGWYYEVTRQWIEEGENNEKSAFVNINLYIKVENEWSKPIPGNGGSSYVSNEKNGYYTSDECYKMATTDALSVACKQLGYGADVYTPTKYDKKPEADKPKYDIIKREITGKEVLSKWNGKIYQNKYVFIDNNKIEPPKDQIERLLTHPKYKNDGKN